MGAAPEAMIVDVPELSVNPVDVTSQNAVAPVADNVTVDAPNVRLLVLVPVEDILAAVTLNPPVFNVPAVRVNALVPILSASCNVHEPPAPLNVNGLNTALPFVVIVLPDCVEANIKALAFVLNVTLVPDVVGNEKLPYSVIAVLSNATDPAVRPPINSDLNADPPKSIWLLPFVPPFGESNVKLTVSFGAGLPTVMIALGDPVALP